MNDYGNLNLISTNAISVTLFYASLILVVDSNGQKPIIRSPSNSLEISLTMPSEIILFNERCT